MAGQVFRLIDLAFHDEANLKFCVVKQPQNGGRAGRTVQQLPEGFLRSKFGVRTKRIAFPTREEQSKLEEKTPEESMPTLALTTRDGLASAAFAVTGAQALRKAAVAGAVVHMIGGILGLAMMMILAILGEETLLTPMNLLLFELIWIVPGFLLSEWTRSV